jgi:hypothetical protein
MLLSYFSAVKPKTAEIAAAIALAALINIPFAVADVKVSKPICSPDRPPCIANASTEYKT